MRYPCLHLAKHVLFHARAGGGMIRNVTAWASRRTLCISTKCVQVHSRLLKGHPCSNCNITQTRRCSTDATSGLNLSRTDLRMVSPGLLKKGTFMKQGLFQKSVIFPFTSCPCRPSSNAPKDHIMTVFDRKTKRMQRNKTAELENYEVYDYIKEEMGYRMYDRICDIKRKFNVAVDLGCGRGHVSKHILEDTVGTLYMCDHAEKVLEQATTSPEVLTHKLHVDEEFIPFKNNSLDLLFSSLSLHWVNDLPGTFKQINNALKPDGAFLGSMFGGETLFELRVSLQLAELEREGGFAPHISPFTDNRDLGSLLNRTGFTLLTIDIDELVVNYPSMYELMWDLKGMGENNCSWNRKLHLHRDTTLAAAAIYKDMYGNEDGSVPATFQVLHFIGWKPDPSQPKVAKRGSGQISIKDLGRLDEIMKEHGEDNENKPEK